MNDKIVFLDIDGVLMPGKAFVLPNNLAVTQTFNPSIHSIKEFALDLTFDPVAVALMNRLCEKTHAKIVIISNWRRTVGSHETREKLIAQGIDETHFHENFYCPRKLTSTKLQELNMWLDNNRTTTTPDEIPFNIDVHSDSDEQNLIQENYSKAYKNYGIDYIVIDDENLYEYGATHEKQIQTNYDEGFTAEDYRVAVGFFDCEDLMFNVFIIDNHTKKEIRNHSFFDDRNDMFFVKWLYSLQDNEEFTAPRACLLSYRAAWLANRKSLDMSLFGIPNTTTAELYYNRYYSALEDLGDN